MKKIGVGVLMVAGWIVWSGNFMLAQDPTGGVLQNPFADPVLKPAAPNPFKVPSAGEGRNSPSALTIFGKKEDGPAPLPGMPMDPYQSVLEKLKPNPNLSANRDIEIDPKVGPWVIQLTYYQGPEAPQMAREMVIYLRQEYKLYAYIFNHGAEEKKKEYDRVYGEWVKFKKTQAEQRAILEKEKGVSSNDIVYGRRYVPYIRLEEQVAVVIGGYKDEVAAKRALDDIRKLKPPDTTKVKVNMIIAAERDPKDAMNLKLNNAEIRYLSPFRTAWVARNPSIKVDRPVEKEGMDLGLLKKYNSDEPYSLLQCKKPYTLVIKVFQVPTAIQGRGDKTGPLDLVGVKKAGEPEDPAANNAHNLAELLRKTKLETYVLHTKFASIVCVGQFDGVEDPNLRTMQNLLAERLRAEVNGRDLINFLARPVPMEVPGVRPLAAKKAN